MLKLGAQILAMDSTWTPERWLSLEDATALLTRGLVHHGLGNSAIVLRGGFNAKSGLQSLLEVESILVTNTRGRTLPHDWAPPVSRDLLIHRDRHLCGYCGHRSPTGISPLITSCRAVRAVAATGPTSFRPAHLATQERNRTPERGSDALLFVPYVPNRFEQLIIENRNCLADQMEFLLKRSNAAASCEAEGIEALAAGLKQPSRPSVRPR